MSVINWNKAPDGAERYNHEVGLWMRMAGDEIHVHGFGGGWIKARDTNKLDYWVRAEKRPSRFDVDAHVSNSACELAKKVGENDSAMVKKAKEILEELFDNKKSGSKYIITIKNKLGESIDVDAYDIITACNITCPAHAHAAKKVLYTGLRGHKDKATDLRESIDALERAIELAK